jgi:hypothetical protein
VDPTIIATVTGILGVIIGAVIGGLFVKQATQRQIEVMLLQSRGDVNERLYSQSLSIMTFFAENPELRPYFYDNKELNRAESELEKSKVLTAAEMVGGFLELVALQIEEQSSDIQLRWKNYICDAYNSSCVLREHLATCKPWYADDLLRLLPMTADEALANKTSDKPGA